MKKKHIVLKSSQKKYFCLMWGGGSELRFFDAFPKGRHTQIAFFSQKEKSPQNL